MLKSDTFKLNTRQQADGLTLMADLNDKTVTDVFFDPQYRGVLDHLSYGNEGVKRQHARCELPQMDEDTIKRFLIEIERILKESGYLFLWVDKFHLLSEGGVAPWFESSSALTFVDLITWDKAKIGMGYRTRRKCEYLIVMQKKPTLAKATWFDHSIPDVWTEKVVKNHPHSKPIELQKALIRATTTENDYICDPASGGYSVLECCNQLNRKFIGCDLLDFENK